MLDPETCHRACEARDRRFDGRFFVGVKSTGIYCRCICSARTPKPANRSFWPSAAAAEAAGFRPCLLCRPEVAPGLAPIDRPARLAAAAYARIESGALESRGLEGLSAELGVTSRHLRRVMRLEFGATPIQIALSGRRLIARRLLGETSMSCLQIALASGFGSLRRFNAAMKEAYGAPPSRMRGRRSSEQGLRIRLEARGRHHLAPNFEFLGRRALPGLEAGATDRYDRVLEVEGAKGRLEIIAQGSSLLVAIDEGLAPRLREIVARVRGAFDLDTDLEVVDRHLARHPDLVAELKEEPRVGVPGALDGFEAAVRAILGQQVSVAAARTLALRLLEGFGASLEIEAGGEPRRLFPRAATLAEAGVPRLAAIGLPRRRAETLHRLAQAVAGGSLGLIRGAIEAGRAALAEIPGIGPWTIEYLAMRVLGDPDAFPATDAAIVAALGRRGDALEELRPWRAYAAVRLWRRVARRSGR